MELDVIFLTISILFIPIFLYFYFKQSKVRFLIPYFVILIVTPLYNLLDTTIFVKVFGCGCVPYIKQNMLSIPMNANHLRFFILILLTILSTLFGVKISKHWKETSSKFLYYLSIIFINLILTLIICKIYLWR